MSEPSTSNSIRQNLSPDRSLRGSLWGYGFLVLFLGVFFHQPLFSGKSFHVWDHSIIYVPMHVYNARLRAEGEIPLWNRHSVLGYPTQAETELSGVYFPSLVFNLISDVNYAYTAYILVHVCLAFVSTMFLAKVAGARPLGQTAAGLVFVFGGSFIGHNYTLTLLTTMSWAPLILALQLRALETQRLKYAVLAGLVLAIQISGAHPQGVGYTLLMMLAASVTAGSGWARLWFAAKTMAVSVLVGIGLSAPQVFYLLEAMSSSSARWVGHGYDWQVQGSAPPLYLLQLLIPDLLGNGTVTDLHLQFGDKRIYCGLLALALLILGWRAASRWVWLFRVIVVAAMLFALGHYFGLYRLLYRLPGFRSIHLPSRFFLVGSLGAAVLIGLGLDRLVSGKLDDRLFRRRFAWGYAALAVVLAAVGLGAWWSHGNPRVVQFYDHALKLGLDPVLQSHLSPADASLRFSGFANAALKASLLAAVCCVFGLMIPRLRQKQLIGVMAITLLAVDLFVSNASVCLYGPPDFYRTVPDTVVEMRQTPGLWRVLALSSHFDLIHPDMAELPQNVPVLYEVDAVQSNLGGPRDDVLEFFGDVFSPNGSLKEFGLFNVRYFLLDRDNERLQPYERWRRGNWRIYENPAWQPRVALRSKVALASSVAVARQAIDAEQFDPDKWVTLNEPPVYLDGEPVTPRPQEASVEVRSYAAQRVVIDVVIPDDRILVLSDLYHSGWEATSNGRPVPILVANGLTRGLALGPGRHEIVFEYWPFSFYSGFVVSGLTLFVLAVWGGVAWLRYRGKQFHEE